MPRSMTGFGRAKFEKDGREYQIELKSVNYKYNDVSVKLPRSISYLEEKIKSAVSKNIARGKVDVFVTFANNSAVGKNVKINKEIAKIYIEELRTLAEETGVEANFRAIDISKMPDVLEIKNEDDEELIMSEIQMPLDEAIANFISMKETEGNKISEDLRTRIKRISEKVEEISSHSTGLIDEYIVKLEARIKEMLKVDVVDETRLAQEVVIYADKTSIQEELTRLRSHIEQFMDILQTNLVVGKKLDFIIQEMNRETNTIGSKSGSLDITNLVIDIKTELEDVREQVQNLE